MKTPRSRYLRYRFPPDIISHAVWLYHRYCMSFRDVEDLLAERGIIVSYETVRQWCGKFGPDYARQLKRRRGRLGDTFVTSRFFARDGRFFVNTEGADEQLANSSISRRFLVDVFRV